MNSNIIPNKDPKTIILFNKLLTDTDLKHQLTLPTHFLNSAKGAIRYRDGRNFITCFDKDGRQWELDLYTRDYDQYAKPTIPQGSWQNFAKHYRPLCGDDAVVFYTRKDDPNNNIQIRLMRKSTVPFAADKHWVELEKKPTSSRA